MSDQKIWRSIGWMALSGFLFAVMTGIVRHVGSGLPSIEAAFIRYAFGLLFIAPLIYRQRHSLILSNSKRLFALRGVVHGFAVMLWFFAMARIPISEVTAIGYLAPVFVTIGAAVFLGEKFKIRRALSIIAGFVGVLIILRPGFQEINSGQIAQLCAAPGFAMSFLIAKKLTDKESPTLIVGMLTISCTLILLPGALYFWQPPEVREVLWLALTAAIATGAHFAMTRAYQSAPISLVQPVSLLQLVWATAIGYVFLGEAVDPYVILGGLIVVLSVSYIAHREAIANRKSKYPMV